MEPERATDNELIEAARAAKGASARRYLDELYRRSYPRVAYWCLRICGDREEATDLAQEVFLRVHARLDSFRMNSQFSTWLYTVARSVAINRGLAARRRSPVNVDADDAPEAIDAAPDPRSAAEQSQALARLREIMESDLEPTEAKVVYLHYVGGLTLPAITQLLELENKSGAKAFMVSGMRKLRRRFREAGGGPRLLE